VSTAPTNPTNTFTLDDIRAAAERKYGSTNLQLDKGLLRLINPLQLSKEKRAELQATQGRLEAASDKEAGAEGDDQEDVIRDALRVVADNQYLVENLIEQVGDNLAVLATIFERYTGQQEVGEASASAS
jgi:hypothetical protein